MLKETETKRLIWRRLLWVAVVGWAVLIFCFSAQHSTASSLLSSSVAAKLVQPLPSVKAMSPEQRAKTIGVVHGFIRKMAHFTIYCVLGVWVCLLCDAYGFSFCKAFFVALGACAAYAVTDEIHQFFVPGRACQLADVFIDSAGATAGILLVRPLCGKIPFFRKQ